MPSIRHRLPFAALRRRRAGRAPQEPVPPDRPASRAEGPPVLAALPEPAPAWATPLPAADLREELAHLEAERAIAGLYGLDRDGLYLQQLEEEIGAALAAYTGTAVIEIALMRAELTGRLQG